MTGEAVAVDFVGLPRGGMRVEQDRSSRGGYINNMRLERPVPGLAPDGMHAMSTPSAGVSGGFRNWANLLDTTISGLCRSSEHMMAATRLRSKENYGTTSSDDLRNITKDHLVDHSGVTNTEVTSTLVHQSLPQHLVEEGHKTAHILDRSHSNVGKHPRTAQLTVFYAGMVNVYDDVPLDKAEAIMVLAGRRRTWASSNDANVLSGSCATECGVPASIAMNQPVSRAEPPSQLTTTRECVPNVQRFKTVVTKVQFPQAKRASLARFLERRKDKCRLRAGPYTSTLRSNCTAPKSSWLSPQTSSALSSPSRRI